MTRYLVTGTFRASFSVIVNASEPERARDIVYDMDTDSLPFSYEEVAIERVKEVDG